MRDQKPGGATVVVDGTSYIPLSRLLCSGREKNYAWQRQELNGRLGGRRCISTLNLSNAVSCYIHVQRCIYESIPASLAFWANSLFQPTTSPSNRSKPANDSSGRQQRLPYLPNRQQWVQLEVLVAGTTYTPRTTTQRCCGRVLYIFLPSLSKGRSTYVRGLLLLLSSLLWKRVPALTTCR